MRHEAVFAGGLAGPAAEGPVEIADVGKAEHERDLGDREPLLLDVTERELVARVVEQLQEDTEKLPHERLSDREFQVFRLMAEGKSLTEIGYQLSVSEGINFRLDYGVGNNSSGVYFSATEAF